MIIVRRKIRQIKRLFRFLFFMVIAGVLFATINGCGGVSEAETPARYSSPELVTKGIVEVSNSVLSGGKKVLTDQDARELTRLCAGGGIEGQVTNLLFRMVDKVGDDVEVTFVDLGTTQITENISAGRIGIVIVYHGGKFVGDKTINSEAVLRIERDRKASGLLSWVLNERSNFWVVTGVE